MVFAMALSLAGLGVLIPDVMLGAGKHLGDIEPANISLALKLNFITQPIYLITICVVKLAVGAALLRIASERFYKIGITGLMIFMALYTTGCLFVRARVPSPDAPHVIAQATDRHHFVPPRLSFSSVKIFASSGTLRLHRAAGPPTRSTLFPTPTLASTSSQICASPSSSRGPCCGGSTPAGRGARL